MINLCHPNTLFLTQASRSLSFLQAGVGLMRIIIATLFSGGLQDPHWISERSEFAEEEMIATGGTMRTVQYTILYSFFSSSLQESLRALLIATNRKVSTNPDKNKFFIGYILYNQ